MSAAPLIEQLSREMGISTATSLFDGHPPRPVHPVLAPMFRRGGLPRGEIVSFTGGQSLTCALAAIAASTQEQKWCAGIGLGEPAVSSIADLGIDLGHFVNLATPPQDWRGWPRSSSSPSTSSSSTLPTSRARGACPTAREGAREEDERHQPQPAVGRHRADRDHRSALVGHRSRSRTARSCLVEARSQTGVHRFLLPGPDGTPAEVSETERPVIRSVG